MFKAVPGFLSKELERREPKEDFEDCEERPMDKEPNRRRKRGIVRAVMAKDRHERYACVYGCAKTYPPNYGCKDCEIDVK